MIKTIHTCWIVSVLSLFLTGCWDQVEVNDLALVMAAGMDTAPEGKIRFTYQIAIPKGGGQATQQSPGKETFFADSGVGFDDRDATQTIQEKLSRKIFLSHRRILIIGEQLARQGIQPYLDKLSRDRNSRLNTYVLVARGSTAAEMLQIPYPYEQVPAEALREIEHSKVGLEISLRDLIETVASDTMSPVLPAIEKVAQSGNNGTSTFRLNGAAVFHHDRLVGWLNDGTTRGLLWLRKQTQQAIITVHVKTRNGNGYISSNVIQGTTNVLAKKENDKIVLYVKADADDDIIENTAGLDLTKPQNVSFIEQMLSKDLRDRIRIALDEIQHRYKSDVVDFGEVIHRTYPKDWQALSKNWDQEFPNLKVVIQTKVKVHRIGLVGHIK
ncbi:Ger(x)C family spore germination protein [Fodinisporobacter ferrooxydans]|uniref:Ger(X)C family spore germination protein n=1 Tax=Fodinisporobacter ferrooxydans TaxID=2901836 RepID=A0ABY4CEB5_9BACL|nr:Ger(x)C family spore germination protein [Alicyclobacillaceae bacterium MYW30-H2]